MVRLATWTFLRLLDDPIEPQDHECANPDVLYVAAGGVADALACFAKVLDTDPIAPAEDVCNLTPDFVEACCGIARRDTVPLDLRHRMIGLIATYVSISSVTLGLSPKIAEHIVEEIFSCFRWT